MSIHLTITADSVPEFDALLARFAAPAALTTSIMPEIAHTPAAVAAAEPAPKGNGRGRKPKETPSAPAADTTPTDTPSSEAPSASPTSGAAVDPFAASGASEATSAAPSTAETTGTPAATSPADQAAAEAGEPTIQQLKDAMADLLKAKSASFAMQTLEQASGCKSLTSGSPNVVEKAKDDPTLMRTVLNALVAAKAA